MMQQRRRFEITIPLLRLVNGSTARYTILHTHKHTAQSFSGSILSEGDECIESDVLSKLCYNS